MEENQSLIQKKLGPNGTLPVTDTLNEDDEQNKAVVLNEANLDLLYLYVNEMKQPIY